MAPAAGSASRKRDDLLTERPKSDEQIALVLEHGLFRHQELSTDHRQILGARQELHGDSRRLDLSEARVVIRERIDRAAIERDAGGDAVTDGDPLDVLVGIDVQRAQHVSRDRRFGSGEIGHADLLALEISVALDGRSRLHDDVPFVRVRVLVEVARIAPLPLREQRQAERRHADADIDVAAIDGHLHVGISSKRLRLDREAFLLVVAEHLADHAVDHVGRHGFLTDAEAHRLELGRASHARADRERGRERAGCLKPLPSRNPHDSSCKRKWISACRDAPSARRGAPDGERSCAERCRARRGSPMRRRRPRRPRPTVPA